MGLDKQEILRINSPGFGHQSYLSVGCARPLAEYKVIVVNPISILHLFDKDPDLLKQIEAAQSEGTTSFSAKSDKLVQSIMPDMEARMGELVQFLSGGGLLVYFLCRPFLVQGPAVSTGNYCWLDVIAPDKSQDKNKRNMSSASHGKNIELTEEGQVSPFARYLRQTGLEWTTLIRTEFLNDGYVSLALAGPNKCVSAYLDAGDQGGAVLFLPAPYLPDYDDTLVSCLEAWLDKRPAGAPAVKAREAEYPPPMELSGMPSPEPAPVKAAELESEAKPEPPAQPESTAAPQAPAEPPIPPPVVPPRSEEARTEEIPFLQPSAEEAKPEARPEAKKGKAAGEQKAAKEEVKPEPAEAAKPEPVEEPKPARPEESIVPKAKDLMEKMEEISKSSAPEWCLEYSFSDLDQLRDELMALNEQVRLTQEKIGEVEGRIRSMEWLKNNLLSAEGDELFRACTKVFEHLGWSVQPSTTNKSELRLIHNDWTEAIARVVRTTSQVKRSDLAQLAESVITYWGEHEMEPKGVLLASTWANRPPSERTEEDYSDALAEFAEKKHLCLMTTWQLLCIYRDLENGNMTPEELRENILSTSGRLAGFVLEPGYAAAAT